MTSATERNPREREILAAAAALVAAHARWADLPGNDPPNARLEVAAETFIAVCATGDVPGSCRDLIAHAATFATLWRRFADGQFDAQGHPDRSLWRALDAVRRASEGVENYQPKRPESVKSLVAQGVPYRQIALHIYGHDGKGIFVGPGGVPNVPLILKEAETPGSVIPEDWIHPSELAAAEAARAEAMTRLSAAAKAVAGADAAGIEGLLREGAFVNQIVNAIPGATRDEVLAVAERIGVVPNERPNLAAHRGTFDKPLTPADEAATRPLTGGPAAPPETPGDDDSGFTPTEIETLVLGEAAAAPGASAGEIAKRIAAMGGPTLSPMRVGSLLKRTREAV